jgi:arylsulfatase A-like enzyme
MQTTAGKISIAGLTLLAATFSSCKEEDTPIHPNILLIMVDDLGYGDLSLNGGTDLKTPHIDRLFSQGIRLSEFYANSTVCSPTRAAMLTGCYPDIAGVPGVIRTDENNSWGYFREDLPTLPDMLKKAGYHTALIGKWHLGLESPNNPNDRGFEYFKGFLGDMMDNYWDHLRHGNNYMRFNEQVIQPQGHATEIFSDWAIEYFQSAASSSKPFFMFLSYNAPHFPIQPPDEWLQKVVERDENITELRAKNIAFVEHMDHHIGRVTDALEQLGLAENTIIIFTSDNGGSLPHGASNGILRGGKQDMYQGGIKIPAAIVWKGKIKPDSELKNMGLTMDLYPTLCETAGVNIIHHIDGVSLLPAIMNKNDVSDSRTVFFMRREGGLYNGLIYYAAISGNYKLVQNTPFEPFQLFDIFNDPLETSPLNSQTPEFKELRIALQQHIKRSGLVPWQKQRIYN